METPSKDPFYPLESQRSFERVSARIKEAIVDGTLQLGERLPSETELAARFAVSRQTIREALRALEQIGFLGAPRKGATGGTTVQNTIAETIGGLFVDAIRMESVSIDQVNVARKAIEGVIVAFAIENADDEDIRLLHENIVDGAAQIDAGGMSTDLDLEFHRLVARASKNPVFEVVADAILFVMHGILRRNPPTVTMSLKAVQSHKLFLEAMKSKDVALGREIMLEHLQEVHMHIKATALSLTEA
jgi:GntR family transcriptional regulator, transcriptional repressor for pyruvate dehydrogenase complex